MAAETHQWDGSDGDNDHTTAANWHSNDTPASTDTCIYPALAAATGVNIDGSDQSAILLAAMFIEKGCEVEFGSRSAYLQMDTDALTFNGDGQAYLDIDNCAMIRIENVAYADSGHSYGFCLVGSGNTALVCDPGPDRDVSLAGLGDEAFTCATMDLRSGRIWMGIGAAATTLNISGGIVNNGSDVTTANVEKAVYRQFDNKSTTLNIKTGGRVYYNRPTADAPTTVNLYAGGILDLSEVADALTIATLNRYGGQIIDPHKRLVLTTQNYMVGGTSSYA